MGDHKLEIRGLRTRHGTCARVPLDLELRSGERLWVHGPSGSGKTALLHALGGLDEAESGEVLFDGESATSVRLRRELSSFVLQEPALIDHWSIRRNLRSACGDAHPEAEALLRSWGVPVDGTHPRQLSGGERQRVSVAIAIARGMPLVIADEPTSSLDRLNRDAVLDAFHSLPESSIVLVCSHDPVWDGWATRRLDLAEVSP
ncbi:MULTISPECIES: ATP-binding cassette domain-containing protein [Actinomycetes]|uniref:ATP-binding cassette domain-containing protein n=1 Tax=Actinomycetes TaxID=1760 RepID=UPI00264AB56E|nr:ATP-binding cassette domain-containing protein [Corynebacterium glyciniphilum]MDN5684374.1 ATP-binding cassette domain-containing protein [Corynebacterium glyciniphilum]